MSTEQYKIYSWFGNFRGLACRIAAEYSGVKHEFVNTPYSELKTPAFLAKHPLGKVPLLECPEGKLFETNAIVRYFARKSQHQLLGTTTFEEAQVNMWLDLIKTSLEKHLIPVLLVNLGDEKFEEKTYAFHRSEILKIMQIFNNHLNTHSYLVGEGITAADIVLAPIFQILFAFVFDEGYRKGHASLQRYYKLLLGQPQIRLYLRKPFFITKEFFSVKAEKPQKADKPKKEQAKKEQPKKEDKPKKEEKPAKPAGDPLLALPESKFNLFDFKTFIVNEKDRQKGCAEFWKQYDPEGYSIWHVKYDKYEGEGVVLYQTSNFKDSFLQRLDHFRKFCYGIHGVYGEEKNYEVEGVWVWRGTGIPQQIKDLPNYEYHFWNKLDHTKEADRKLLEEYWCGLEEDVAVVNGKVARDVTQFK